MGAGDFGAFFEVGFEQNREKCDEGEEGGAGEGCAELVLVVEEFDVEREGVGSAADVGGNDGHGAEFAHGACLAEECAVEERPFDVGEGDFEENGPRAGAEGDGGDFLVVAGGGHKGDEGAGDVGEGDEGGGEEDAGCFVDDLEVVSFEPRAEPAA